MAETSLPTASLSDAMKTLLLSLTAYSAVFAYEVGYCGWFCIPIDLIRLDTTRLLVFGSIGAILLLCFLPTLTVLYGFSTRVSPSGHAELNSFLAALGVVLIATLFLFAASGGNWLMAASMLFGYVAVTLPQVFKAFRLSDNRTFAERLVAVRQEMGSRESASIAAKIRRGPLILFCVVVYLWLLSWNFGRTIARTQMEFLYVEARAPTIVLRIYGDRLICARVDEVNKKTEKAFSIIDLGKDFKASLRLQSVGPLTVNKH